MFFYLRFFVLYLRPIGQNIGNAFDLRIKGRRRHANEYDYCFTVRYLIFSQLRALGQSKASYRFGIVLEFVGVQSLSSIVCCTRTPRRQLLSPSVCFRSKKVHEMALRQAENNKNAQHGNEASLFCTAVIMRTFSLMRYLWANTLILRYHNLRSVHRRTELSFVSATYSSHQVCYWFLTSSLPCITVTHSHDRYSTPEKRRKKSVEANTFHYSYPPYLLMQSLKDVSSRPRMDTRLETRMSSIHDCVLFA